MKISIGNPVEGDDFFDREKEQARAWRKLEGSHLLMLAPRRIGKTSLILRLCATAHEHGFKAAACSFAQCETEGDCVRLLIDTLKEGNDGARLWSRLAETLERVKGIKIGPVGLDLNNHPDLEWRAVGEALGTTLAETDENWLICVDELPVFIVNLLKQGDEGKRRARAFLYWFRDLRQRHYKKVKWLTAGSIGLDTVASRLGLTDAINDLEPFPLAAFDEPVALRFLAKLAESYGIPMDEDIRKAIVKMVGWPVPYYLQLMFSQLREEWDETGQAPDLSAIDRAFERLLDPAYRVHFDYWRQRLEEELGQPEAGHAAFLLDGISANPEGDTKATLSQRISSRIQEPEEAAKMLNYLLEVLTADGYLVERNDRYAYRLEWLRAYWQRRCAA
jgi:hypothetical protein